MNVIKKLPLPICGTMLGLFAVGNLISDYFLLGKYICGAIGFILLMLVLTKLIKYPKDILNDFKNPIITSVSGTFLMSLIILSTYIAPFNIMFASYLWMFAVFLFAILIIYFTIMFFIKNFELKNVYASYYITYIGIVIASVSSPLYNQINIGKLIFIFGSISFIFLLGLTAYRYLKLKTPEQFKPLICINAAPFSLLLYGYLKTFTNISYEFVIFMFIFAVIFYIFAIAKFLEYKNIPFYPSYSAFAFPFVVAALASKATSLCLKIDYLNYLVYIQTTIAVLLVFYVFFNYCKFLFTEYN